MHRLVVGFDREAGNDLLPEADPGAKRGGRGGEAAVVVSLATTEAAAGGGEGHAGAKEELDVFKPANRSLGRRLGDAEGAGDQCGGPGEVEAHRVAIDPRQNPSAVGKVREQGQQQRFAGQGGEGGDGPCRVVGQPVAQVAADVRGLGELGFDARPRPSQRAAEFGLGIAGTCHLQWPDGAGNLAAVRVFWQAVVLILCWSPLTAAEVSKFQWTPPKTGAGLFSERLGMLEREREEYADSLAAYASGRVAAASASAASLTEARRLVALALHLSPRNRKALVLSFQLSRGVLPDPAPGDYRPDVLAGLLFTRGQLLRQQGGEENLLLARIFTELSAEMNPKNDDAVYASELQRLDHGPVDWSALTDAAAAGDGAADKP